MSLHPFLSLSNSRVSSENSEKYETFEHLSAVFFNNQLRFLKQVLNPFCPDTECVYDSAVQTV